MRARVHFSCLRTQQRHHLGQFWLSKGSGWWLGLGQCASMNQCGGKFRVRRRTATLGGTVLGEAMFKTQEIAPIPSAAWDKHVCGLGACARRRATKGWFARHSDRRSRAAHQSQCQPGFWHGFLSILGQRLRLGWSNTLSQKHNTLKEKRRQPRILITCNTFSGRSGGHSGANFLLSCGGLQVFILAKGVAFAAKSRVVNGRSDWAKEHNHRRKAHHARPDG